MINSMTGKSSFCTISHNFSHGFKIKEWQKALLKSGVDLSLIHLVGVFLSVIIKKHNSADYSRDRHSTPDS